VAWIITEHTRVFFSLRTLAADVPAEQPVFDEWLRSAKIP
jgi:hypothetical protein